MQTQAASIEELVVARRQKLAHQCIQRYLQQNGKTPESILQAVDWYRRLVLYHKALTVLSDALEHHTEESTQQRLRLSLARILNLLGASSHALAASENIRASSSEDFRILGNIYLSNFEYDKALKAFAKMQKLDRAPLSYQSRLAVVSYADALSGVGRHEEALQLVGETERRSPEPLLKGIAQQACAEYLCALKRYREALQTLDNAKKLFSSHDKTLDHGFLFKWLAIAHAGLGHKSEAKAMFRKALAIVHRPGVRAEAWLEIYRQMENHKLLTKTKQRILASYPSKERLRSELALSSRHASFKISLNQNEFTLQTKRYYGLSEEIRLLAYLRLADRWGLNVHHVQALLWPSEWRSFRQLNPRLHQLIRRLRKHYRFKITWDEQLLRLNPECLKDIEVHSGAETRPSLLLKTPQSSRLQSSEIGAYYQLGRTQCNVLIKNWITQGWLKAEGRAPRLSYKVI